MKNLIFVIFLFNYTLLHSQSNGVENNIESILYLQDSNPLLTSRTPDKNDIETDYISYNTSNVGIRYINNIVFISWEVCDDSTNSFFEITRTTDNINFKKIKTVKNIPCNPHIPLLYGCEDRGVILDKDYFYFLNKILDDGSKIHIITLILPKRTENKNLSYGRK